MDITVGTAGHIDHGKTTLIKALTGIDADRLPEEKQRGITIDLGFAELDLGDVRVGFVDVPGHERFVKNMLAGVSGIDLVMLVIAADEGVMPQTREHFDICRLLNVRSGIVVLTKCEMVDDETLELAHIDAAELVQDSFLENAPVVTVSARSGIGIEELKSHLKAAALRPKPKWDDRVTRLPIDRSFTVKGFGAVVTGTLGSGTISEGAELELLPERRQVRVRGLQVHGRKAESVFAGQRTAVNLGGIEHASISRGMVLCEPNVLEPTQTFDAEIAMLGNAVKSVRSRQRVRVHIGTVEAFARVSVLSSDGEILPGATGLAQFRLETQIACVSGDRFIIRQYSPQVTVGGGRVLDPFAERHQLKDFERVCKRLMSLSANENDLSAQVLIHVEATDRSGIGFPALQARTGISADALVDAINDNIAKQTIRDASGQLISNFAFAKLISQARSIIGEFHDRRPLDNGMPIESLRDAMFAYVPATIVRSVMHELEEQGEIVIAGDIVRLADFRTELSDVERIASERIRAVYNDSGLDVPRLGEVLDDAAAVSGVQVGQVRRLLQLLVDAGEIIKVTDEFYFARPRIDALVESLRARSAVTGDSLIDVAQFKEMAGISRKYAIPLLEHLDRTRVTVRAGDKRKII